MFAMPESADAAPPIVAALVARGFNVGVLHRGLATAADVKSFVRLSSKAEAAIVIYDADGSSGEDGPAAWPQLRRLLRWAEYVAVAHGNHEIEVPACRLLIVYARPATVARWACAAASASRKTKMYLPTGIGPEGWLTPLQDNCVATGLAS